MKTRNATFYARMLSGAALLTAIAGFSDASAAQASESAKYNIAPQPLDAALREFGFQSGHTIIVDTKLTGAKTSRGLSFQSDPETALRRLLNGTGLSYRREGDIFAIVAARADGAALPAPSAAIAAETVLGSAVEGLVVTAQKRREQIQDVPIAISAFSADTLQAQKIEGGFDLLKAIPNVTFSKNNFSGYNFSIRGIGTKAISVTTDPGVAVEFNDTPLIRNRLFEQEYFDVERVEVLRGPQGTLHGRNATAGVINVISNTPDLDAFDGTLKGEVGNYHTKRLSGFINIPIIEDVLAVRFAGALTDRDGYDYNATTKNAINGRDLWSGRLTIGFEPTESIRADFIWERFNEDDNRSRTGKQLCHRDAGPDAVVDPVAGTWVPPDEIRRGALSQGCKPGSLYDAAAFGTPNGLSVPFLQAAGDTQFGVLGFDAEGNEVRMINSVDPYGGMMQSPDLRVINSIKDPRYQANTDVFELNVAFDVTDNLTFTSQTAYVQDQIYSFQDFNRFNTVPIFNDSTRVPRNPTPGANNYYADILKGGIFCDPQLGCSDSIAGFDISRAKSTQFSQEFRLQSSFDGPINFGVGAHYTSYKTLEDYFVLYNAITLVGQAGYTVSNRSADPAMCMVYSFNSTESWYLPNGGPGTETCVYVDPNPVESMNGEGHNYFRSKNPYSLKAYGAFGEVYWEATDTIKVTAGLRYNDDQKTFTPVPSQTLLSAHPLLLGTVGRGYPSLPDIKQRWGEVTGRIGVDWKPDLAFTDETLLYAFYSRGYKGGGANPPGIGFSKDVFVGDQPVRFALPYPEVFDPEFINAYEVGAKNTLLGGALTLNSTAFYYDYKDYQVSQIKERTAVNENFDATVWGLEFETMFAPTQNLRINATLGFQDTKIADGEQSLDLMNRTQSDPAYVIVRPFFLFSSSCVVPREAAVSFLSFGFPPSVLCGLPQGGLGLNWLGGPNDGQGFFDDLSGNELPNAPHWTVSLGAQQTWDMMDGWQATARADAYWQSQSWARVYNAVNDKLHGWYNTNLSFWLEKPEADLKIEFYVKNALNDTPITDAFLNSDDTALTTNVFTLDPRLIGLQITKGF